MSSYLEVLVSAQNFSEIINRFEIVSFYLRHDLALLDKVENQCQEIDEQRQMLTGHYEDLQREKNRIGALKKQHIKAKDRLAIAVTRRERELARIQKDRERLERELDELETSRELEDHPQKTRERSGPRTGKIQWPCGENLFPGAGGIRC